jgi:uncharacterized protein
MLHACIRCYAELNDLLPHDWRFITFDLSLPPQSQILDLLDDIGIPPNLIDVVLLNNVPVSLSVPVEEGDRIAFYPVFETFDISSVTKVRDHPLREIKFILDVHLGKLAHQLRMLGFDTLYQNQWTAEASISISREERRIFLTRSTQRWIREAFTHYYVVKNTHPHLQLTEVLEWFDLFNMFAPFTRCIKCNSVLTVIKKEAVLNQIPEQVKSWCQEYHWCHVCSRIYWKGSHYEHMDAFIQNILRTRSDDFQTRT